MLGIREMMLREKGTRDLEELQDKATRKNKVRIGYKLLQGNLASQQTE
jgi:hypothetical protein